MRRSSAWADAQRRNCKSRGAQGHDPDADVRRKSGAPFGGSPPMMVMMMMMIVVIVAIPATAI